MPCPTCIATILKLKQASRLKQNGFFQPQVLVLTRVKIKFSCLAMQRAFPLVGLCVRTNHNLVSLNSLNAVTMLGLYDSWNLYEASNPAYGGVFLKLKQPLNLS
jgi:hypothetical protein